MSVVPPTSGRGLLYGGDYNPEQWPEEIWQEDVRLMREAGVNLVTVAVFAWAHLEPSPGRYEFGWLDRLIDLVWANGIGVDLATATASPPAWLVRAHPEILPTTADGVRLEFGSRQHYCPSSPVLQEHTTALVERLAERYCDHPALALWHISNEYGDHVFECFCDVSAAHFRRWLRGRYGEIEALNKAWGTYVWAQRYRDWDEITPPRTAPGPVNPTQLLDWRRFSSAALLEVYEAEAEILRRLTPRVPVTTNFMSTFKWLDCWRWAAREDVVTDDAYPDPADPDAHYSAATNYDLMRSLRGGQPWILLEQAPSAVSWRDVNVPKPPGIMRLWSHQALARGADGVMFFQWRASRSGAEKFHSAMLPHGGTSSRGWRQTTRLGNELQALAEIAGSHSTAEVAILFDWESWWALETHSHPSDLLRLDELLRRHHRPFYEANVAVDFAGPESDLSRYRLLVVPNLYLTTPESADRIAEFCRRGGIALLGFFSGVVDRDDRVHEGSHPGAFRELLGLVVDEYWPLPPGASCEVEFAWGGHAAGDLWSEWLLPDTAEVVATYADGHLIGLPAATRNPWGEGAAYYTSTALSRSGLAVLVSRLLAEARIEPVGDAPPAVELTRRASAEASYLFALNHGAAAVDVPLVRAGVELLRGIQVEGSLRLEAHDVAVVREAGDAAR